MHARQTEQARGPNSIQGLFCTQQEGLKAPQLTVEVVHKDDVLLAGGGPKDALQRMGCMGCMGQVNFG